MVHTRAQSAAHRPSIVTASDSRGGLRASLCPHRGGELSSLSLEREGGAIELLYRGNNFTSPPDGSWQGRAPWLWPMAGRCFTDEVVASVGTPGFDRDKCCWRLGDKVMPMRHHGFVKDMRWRAERGGDATRCKQRLSSKGEHREMFPFDFTLCSEAEASPSGMTLRMQVKADDRNSERMPFQLGLHLTFDLSQWWGDSWLSGAVHGLGDIAYDCNAAMQPNRRVQLPPNGIPLNHPATANAIIPAGANRAVRLVAPDGDAGLSMRFESSPMIGEDDAIWVTHCDPHGRFYCCEPWIGWPNALNNSRGCVYLDPGATWIWSLHFSLD